jgi:hypothetical protein
MFAVGHRFAWFERIAELCRSSIPGAIAEGALNTCSQMHTAPPHAAPLPWQPPAIWHIAEHVGTDFGRAWLTRKGHSGSALADDQLTDTKMNGADMDD